MSIKKMFSEKSFKKNVIEFLYKKGFYIALILCVVVVGITAIYMTTSNLTSTTAPDDNNKLLPENLDDFFASDTDGEDAVQSSISTEDPDENEVAGITNEGVTQQDQVQNDEQTHNDIAVNEAAAQKQNEANQAAAENFNLTAPVFGTTIKEFSEDELLYFATLEDWRTHSAIDIASDRGNPVKAAADGVISDVKQDPRFGITVIIDHQNGFKTIYANLASDEMVTPNQIVEKGDAIGSIGSTAAFESVEPPHLHFAVWQNDEPIDPGKYLPGK